MSMYRQLWLAIMLSSLLALIGSLLASTLSSQSYLNEQLRMKNADNATTLALSLSQKNIDHVELGLIVAALFDSGHYASIKVSDPAGKVIVERVATPETSKVPAWFVQAFPIVSAPGQAQISSGWKQLGSVALVTHSAYAYQTLWDSTQKMVAALTLSGLIAGYLATLILRRLKQPLRAVIEQANALRERRFIVAPESTVPELRRLSGAMNSTVTLLKSMFAEEAERLETLRRQANTDALTGLANRSHFLAQLQVMLDAEDAPPGSLLILRLSRLAELNRQQGRIKADALLQKTGALLSAQAQALPEGFAARLNGSDFALLLRQTEAEPVAFALLQAITSELGQLPDTQVAAFLGFGGFEYGAAPGTLLSQVDAAVAGVESSAASGMREAAPLQLEPAPRSAEEWSALIQRALEQRQLKLVLFPVLDFKGIVIHREAALRLMFGTEWIVAGRFLPIAERLGLTTGLDLAAVSLGLDELSRNSEAEDVAINLSAQSIQDAGFRQSLRALLSARPAASKRLWLEIPEHGALARLDTFRMFCQEMRASGCKLGLEHYARQFGQIDLVQDPKLDYIKIDASFIRDIESNSGNQAFLRGVTKIAHHIGLQVFAEGVVRTAELPMLDALGFDGATGPAIPGSVMKGEAGLKSLFTGNPERR